MSKIIIIPGLSDFHMQNKKSGEMIFNSCKCYKEEKSPNDYGIRNMKQRLERKSIRRYV